MQIRTLAPTDAAAFQTVRLRGLLECPEAFASSHEEELPKPLSELETRLLPKPDAAIFGAFDGETLVALVGVRRESMVKLAHKAIIWGMYVVPEARGHGLGVELLQHALDYAAASLNVRQVNLGVNTKNTAAVALYRKLGFVEFGIERGFMLVAGELQDEYQMVCHVQGFMPEKLNPIAVTAAEVPARSRPSIYPEPFASRMAGREKRPLGDLFGLMNFGVNLTRLAPNAVSALRHAHTRQDEFIYVLQGQPTLHTDEGRTRLAPGMCAGFNAGTGNAHRLINDTREEVVYLEVGDRTPGDAASYPDDDLKALFEDGKWNFVHKDDTPYA